MTPDDPAIRAGDDEISHRDLLAVAADLVVDYGMDGDTRLVVRETFTGVEAVAAGVIAPLSCGGTVVLDRSVDPENGDIAIVQDAGMDVPEPRRIVLTAVCP